MQDFNGVTAVVTGAGSGIGRGIALALSANGASVVVADIDAQDARLVADEIAAAGGNALPATVDVMHLDSVRALAERVRAELGDVVVLCNNAGVSIRRRGIYASHEDWEWVLGVNLWGVIHGLEAFLPGMLSSGREGHVVNTASMNGIFPSKHSALYSTSKYGVVGLTETLRNELAGTGIGASVLCPAGVKSRIVDSERNRPERLAGPAVAPPHEESSSFSLSPAREPLEVGEMVVDAIRHDDLYIFTDPVVARLIEAHHEAMMRGFDRLAEWDAHRARDSTS